MKTWFWFSIASLLAAVGSSHAASEAPRPSVVRGGQDCYHLPSPTAADPSYDRAVALVQKRHWWSRTHQPDVYTLVLHAVTGSFERRSSYTYPSAVVRLCITDLDYRLRYHLGPLSTINLQPVPVSILGSQAPAAAKVAGETDATLVHEESSKELVALSTDVFHTLMEKIDGPEIVKTVPKKPLRSADQIRTDLIRYSDSYERIDEYLAGLTRESEWLPSSVSKLANNTGDLVAKRQVSLNSVNAAADELTGEIPVLAARAAQLETELAQDGVNLDQAAAGIRSEAGKAHRLHEEIARYQSVGKNLENVTDRLRQKLERRSEEIDLAAKVPKISDPDKEAFTLLKTMTLSLTRRLQRSHDQARAMTANLTALASTQEKMVAPDSSDGAEERRALSLTSSILDHFAVVEHNVFYLPIDQDKEVTVTVKTARLALDQREGTKQPAPGSDTKTKTDKPPPALDTAAPPPSGTTPPKSESAAPRSDATAAKPEVAVSSAETSQSPAQYALKYVDVPNSEMAIKFQVRSLTYFRINVGLAYTSLRNPGFTLGFNDTGAQVITHGSDPGIFPMFVLSHYWCGVDLRQLQPYDRFRTCGWKNTFLPTFALGIPLSKNPIENLFLGGMLQPVPGLAFVFGAHLGQVRVLKHGYVDGQQPPLIQGQAFDVQQAQEDRLRLGYFLGVVITDSIFVPFIARIAGLNN